MTDRPAFDTRALLRRSRLTAGSVALLAWLEGATHQLQLSPTRVQFYRHAYGGAIETASAGCDETGWSLSTWAPRVTARLPPTAKALARPEVRAGARAA